MKNEHLHILVTSLAKVTPAEVYSGTDNWEKAKRKTKYHVGG